MALFTTNANAAFLPADIGPLIVKPALDLSVAAQVSTTIRTASHQFHIPVWGIDQVAHWVAEGDPIGISDPTLSEVVVVPSKIAVITVISRELADDASPEAATIVGQGLARSIARCLDLAYFGDTVADGQDGLLSLTTSTSVEAASSFSTLDSFASAIFTSEGQGANVDTFVTSPAEALALSTVKEITGSTRPLLTPDPTTPTARTIYGRPLLTSSAVSAKTAWAVPRSTTFLLVRDDARIEVDRSAYFGTDQVGVKCSMRVGFGFAHPLSIVKVTHA